VIVFIVRCQTIEFPVFKAKIPGFDKIEAELLSEHVELTKTMEETEALVAKAQTSPDQAQQALSELVRLMNALLGHFVHHFKSAFLVHSFLSFLPNFAVSGIIPPEVYSSPQTLSAHLPSCPIEEEEAFPVEYVSKYVTEAEIADVEKRVRAFSLSSMSSHYRRKTSRLSTKPPSTRLQSHYQWPSLVYLKICSQSLQDLCRGSCGLLSFPTSGPTGSPNSPSFIPTTLGRSD